VRRKFKEQDRGKIVEFWLQGMSYREIAERTKASLGTISAEIEKVRKVEPNLDSLRELNATLQKSAVAVADAIRACSLLPRLDELGIGINELAQYVELSKKLAEEYGIDVAEFVEAAIRLSKWEAQTGKSRKALLKEFKEKTVQLRELKSKIRVLRDELKDVRKQREISRLCEQLKAIGIKPGRLEEFIARKGSLEKQLSMLEEGLEQGKARLKILAKMERDIQRRVDDIQRIERILQGRVSSFACPRCGWATLREVRRFEVQMALSSGQLLTVACQRCGTPNRYDPRAILLNLGLEILS